MPRDWTRDEVEATVSDYLAMLLAELSGEPYSKAGHRRHLMARLGGRSDSAIERKHQNISAALIELGLPYVDGYKPLSNYQQLLFDVVADVAGRNARVLTAVASHVEAPACIPSIEDILHSEVPAPRGHEAVGIAAARRHGEVPGIFRQVNYLAREASNASLGSAGEGFVIRFETARLVAVGEERLASKIEHVSVTEGDGAGFDVLSFDVNGRERLIEVKTTAYGVETPFFVSDHEVAVSRREREHYRVYRLFDFRRCARFFQKRGEIDVAFNLRPVQFEVRLA